MNQTPSQYDNQTATRYLLLPEPEPLRIARTVVVSLLLSFSLVGNYVVCRAVWRQPGHKPLAHYLVSNLAFAEILNTVSIMFTIHADEPPWSWKLGSTMCKILIQIQVASLLVITTTLATLAVYRCLLLVKPLVTKPTRRQMRCIIIFTWVGSFVLTVPSSAFHVVKVYDKHPLCEEIFPPGYEQLKDIYSIVVFILNFALPLAIMVVSYAMVSKKIREHIFVITRLRDEQNKAFSSVTNQSTLYPEEPRGASLFSQSETENREEIELVNIKVDAKKLGVGPDKEKKALKESVSPFSEVPPVNNKTFELENDLLRMVFALVLIFVVCYIPYQVSWLLFEFRVNAFIFWPYRYIAIVRQICG
ncbi:Orexin receptor type 2 [Stylophora pistillata]|uniref:Orexin receptor type 2 n=1 Tax=Stylophora pistillata TaxID=50429 RepID=A0A2B4RRY0_STYPI|nr:Orexin receptor type 2 [Stylophora pistillata]